MVNKPSIKKQSFIWDGLYPTWKAACNAARKTGNPGGGLTGKRWLKRITQQLIDYRTEFARYGTAIPPRPCNLPFLCAVTNPRKILDFGGSSGWSWEYLKNSLPCNRVASYVILEKKQVVDHMRKLKAHKHPVSYKTGTKLLKQYDVLYCNSVLQYFSSNRLFLSLVKKVKPNYIFLEDTIAKSDRDLFSCQRFYDSKLPYRFIGLRKMLKELTEYTEVLRFPYAAPILGVVGPLGMENLPAAKRIRYASSILLKKVDKE